MSEPEDISDKPQEAPQTAAMVREFFSANVKTAKAMNLYMGKGASVQRFVADLEEIAGRLFEAVSSVSVEVQPDGFFHDGAAVEKSEEGKQGIAYELFADGIRELTLRRGLDRGELLDLVEVLRTRRSQLEESGQDLVTFFWSKEFSHVSFRAVEAFLEGEGGGGGGVGSGEGGGGEGYNFDSIWPAGEDEGGVSLKPNEADVVAAADPATIVAAEEFARSAVQEAAVLASAVDSDGNEALAQDLQRGRQRVLKRWMKLWEEGLATGRREPEREERAIQTLMALFLERVQAGDLLGTRLALAAVASSDRRLKDKGALARRFAEIVAEPENLQQLMLRSAGWDLEWVQTFLAIVSAMPRERMPTIIEGIHAIKAPKARVTMLRSLEERGIDVSGYRAEQLLSDSDDEVLDALRAAVDSPEMLADAPLEELLEHRSLEVRRMLLKVLPANRTTVVAVARKLRSGDREPEWVNALLRWVHESRRPPVLDDLLALAMRLDPDEDPNMVRKTFRVMAMYGAGQVKGRFQKVLGQTGVRRHSEERKMLLLAALADDGAREWRELIRPITKGWLTSKRLQAAAAAALKKLEQAKPKARKRGKQQ